MLPLLLLIFFTPETVVAQGRELASHRLRLFLDCHTDCDESYLRTTLTVVDWVTDRTVADVHVIATELSTGAGGSQITLTFLGRGALANLTDTIEFQTSPDASEDDERREFARVLRLGLVRYLLAARQADNLNVALSDTQSLAAGVPAVDRWDHWVFSVGGNFEFDAESRETQYQVGGDLSANRTTADWKVRLELGGGLDRTTFTLDDGSKFAARRDGWDAYDLVVRSVGPHWSVGATTAWGSSKPDNLDLRSRVAPAIEWDYFPYDQATRRQFIVVYSLGVTRFDYVDITIFDKLGEVRFDHSLQAAFESRQPWGSARVSGSASTFLDAWTRNRLSASASIEVRVARGLAFDVEARYARVRDQITLRKGDASDEEIFLRLRELATDFEAGVEIGLNYTFGSFLNSIVNPRFDEVD
jgi:hypothetical protein